MNVKIKLLPDGALPMRGSREAAGYDIYAAENVEIGSLEIAKIRTGVCFQMPPGFCGEIEDRSSVASRGLVTIGRVIDSDYRGEVCVIFLNVKSYSQKIYKGDRIAQIKFEKIEKADFEIVKELDPSDRGKGGFGSTGV